MQDSLYNWRHGSPYSLHILGFFLFLFGQSLCEWASPHTHCFLAQFCALCPKPWHLKHCWIEGVILNSSTLKTMPVFWHISPPEISASACFGSSLLIFINGRSLPVLFDFIHNCGWAICRSTFVTRDTICSAVKLNVLLGGGGEACFTMEA